MFKMLYSYRSSSRNRHIKHRYRILTKDSSLCVVVEILGKQHASKLEGKENTKTKTSSLGKNSKEMSITIPIIMFVYM